MAWLTWRADDSGQWLFLVFTVFFALLVASPWLPKLKTKPPPEPATTRFVPHWFMMLAALVLVALALSVILSALRQFF
jgi:protein-S-isoprenylcysteine O-methyltransferase Ste14